MGVPSSPAMRKVKHKAASSGPPGVGSAAAASSGNSAQSRQPFYVFIGERVWHLRLIWTCLDLLFFSGLRTVLALHAVKVQVLMPPPTHNILPQPCLLCPRPSPLLPGRPPTQPYPRPPCPCSDHVPPAGCCGLLMPRHLWWFLAPCRVQPPCLEHTPM